MEDEVISNYFWFNDQDNEPNDAKTRKKYHKNIIEREND